MRIMIDTNIFISAILFPNGKASIALFKALMPPYHPVTCDYVIDELRRKFREKFPDKITELDAFLFSALSGIDVIKTPDIEDEDEKVIRDEKDRPILRAALSANVDYFLTGDKDFLEAAIDNPKVISVSDFLDL